jgi:methylase of polypeptide subunit release factors
MSVAFVEGSTAINDAVGYETNDVFCCWEESRFYAQCLKSLVLGREDAPRVIVEFGAGDGRPVIEALRESRFTGLINGFELNPSACDIANASIKVHGLHGRYRVYNESFFAHGAPTDAECLIANPPYLPAPDRNIRMPLLYGGEDGSAVTRRLLSAGYDSALLMVSSYSNPAGVIRHSIAKGYGVSDFIIAPLTFGIYSSELRVKQRIKSLRKAGLAFYDGDMYLLAGVLFKKPRDGMPDRSCGLIDIMTAL